MQLDPITRAVLDAMQEGVLIIDAQERIVYGNRAYVAFLEKEAGGPIGPIEGYPLRLLRPGARLPEVLAQKRPILHTPRQESEDIYFVNMYPIFDGAEVVGGLSVVTFWKDAFDFRAELERYEKRSRQVLRRVNKANAAHYTFDSIVAVSPRSAACRELASRLAQTDVTVLLQSESGTGKELYAQAIHNASPRSAGVFVAINCANFNANMLESELFGYTEGAFTGAKRGGKIGLFEAAAGGTLFLDEISEMDVGLQAKLLRALQERRIRPVGGVEEVETDVRIIAACNADFAPLCGGGEIPHRPVLPPQHLPHPHPAAAGAERGHPSSLPQPAGRAVPQAQATPGANARGHGPPAGPQLAGQCAGAAQRAGVLRLSHPLRRHHRAVPPRKPPDWSNCTAVSHTGPAYPGL